MSKKGIVIAGVSSNSGKTITSLSISAGLSSLGFKVSNFKVGPDFIDPSFHREISGQCYNLDPVMSSPEFIRYLVSKKGSKFNIIEGAMGMLDGETYGGSTKDVAEILGIPSLLCVDVSSMGESIRGVVKGFSKSIIGVIAVKTGSEKHVDIIRKSLKKEKIELLGYIPHDKELEIKTRHLGLVLAKETDIKKKKKKLEEIFHRFFKKEKIVSCFGRIKENHKWEIKRYEDEDNKNKNNKEDNKDKEKKKKEGNKRRIYVLSGEPFSFVYPENILILEDMGFEVIKLEVGSDEFREISKREMSKEGSTDIVLIPGGYPELHMDFIQEYREEIKNVLKNAKKVIAECGGLELLSDKIIFEGAEKEGLGILPIEIKIERKLQAIGWRKAKWAGKWLKGHEFHYGRIYKEKSKLPRIISIYDMKGKFLGKDGIKKGKFICMWFHLYIPSDPMSSASFIIS